MRFGPVEGGRPRRLADWSSGLGDLLHTSPRRVGALTWLAYKESIRRKVLWAFGVFILHPAVRRLVSRQLRRSRPADVYLNFVMTATWYLVLVLAMVLSAFSLPTDISRPARSSPSSPSRSAGRRSSWGGFFGFTATGTVLLAVHGVMQLLVRGRRAEPRRISLRERDLDPGHEAHRHDPILPAGRRS